ncbi:MAG: hypothetical protein J0H81_07165, partial [Sphingopyxis terrae]|nr:hypothetical protein [Sphingopyxis terrae]
RREEEEMTARPWVRWAILPLALFMSSCSLQRVNDSVARAELEGKSAGQYTKYLQNLQPEQARDTVVFSNKPWVSTQPLVTKRGLPRKGQAQADYIVAFYGIPNTSRQARVDVDQIIAEARASLPDLIAQELGRR